MGQITGVRCSYNTDPHTYAICIDKPYEYQEIIGFSPEIKRNITLEVLVNIWLREDVSHDRWLLVDKFDVTMVNYITKGDIPTLIYFTLKRSEEYNVVHIKFINVDYNYETQRMLNGLRSIEGRIDDKIHKELVYKMDEVSHGTYACSTYRNYEEFIKAHIKK